MPSLLDGMPSTEAEFKEIHAASAAMIGAYVAAGKLTPKAKSVFDALGAGLSLADIVGVTEREREGLLVHGAHQLRHGDRDGALDTLLTLYRLEPTDPRAVYALATAFQAKGEYAYAGKLYLVFLALDATNPQGFLRLGECFLANREPEAAQGYFEAGKAMAAGTPAEAAVAAHADAMLGAIAARAAA